MALLQLIAEDSSLSSEQLEREVSSLPLFERMDHIFDALPAIEARRTQPDIGLQRGMPLQNASKNPKFQSLLQQPEIESLASVRSRQRTPQRLLCIAHMSASQRRPCIATSL